MRRTIIALLCSLTLGYDTVSWSQVQYFGCAEVRFFGPACPPGAELERQPEAEEAPEETTALHTFHTLFPPGTMSPYTPPLLVQLLAEPTRENAQRYLAWQQAQLARIQEVQALLRQLQMEHVRLQSQGSPARACQSCPVGEFAPEGAGRK